MALGIAKLQLPLLNLLPTKSEKQADRLSGFKKLNKRLATYMPSKRRAIVAKAYRLAERAHRGQNRASGEPYITHPIAVAQTVAEMKLDHEAISAALMHDVVEDTPVTLAEIREQFGPNIAAIVDGLTKLDNIRSKESAGPISPVQSENFQKLVLATAKDLRVVLIKFADRMHNLRTVEALNPAKRKRMAKETMLVYAPLANRLGMEKFRMELEDLSFAAAYPMRYQLFKSAVERARSYRVEYIKNTTATIEKIMKERKIKCRVISRRKNLAGIYAKMSSSYSSWLNLEDSPEDDKKSLQEIMDVFGVRIIVNKVDQCYRTLGIMHSSFKPINRRFKDYIANPKKNGYQSLHTTLVGPQGFPMELQIRTESMEYMAESGIAAHFLYKNSPQDPARLYSWLQGLARIQADSDSTSDFMHKARQEFSLNEIFVYTPKGDLISLPEGATPVDFAYAVHTDLGAKCIACEIDRVPAPLNTRLSTGQVIDIITDADSSPDISWSASSVTPKALSHIASYARLQQNIDIYGVGEKMLRDAMVNHFDCELRLVPDDNWANYLLKHNLKNKEELYAKISTGEITPLVAAVHLLPTEQQGRDAAGKGAGGGKSGRSKSAAGSIAINKRLATIKYARCCHPVPGDSIVAISTRQDGIHIHRAKCRNLQRGDNKKANSAVMAAHWEEEMQDGEFLVSIRCEVNALGDIMSRIVNTLSYNHIGVQEVVTEHSTANVKVLVIIMLVHSRAHLSGILRKLRLLKGVLKVNRV